MAPGDVAFDPDRTQARDPVPELPGTLRWVNRDAAARLSDLRGRVVLLVFWNGTGVASDDLWSGLRVVRDRYRERLAVLGVHTPRYVSQQDDEVVRHAVRRLALRIPVANDPDWLAWRQYAVAAWPTTLVLDAERRLAARFAGAGRAAEIEDVVLRLQHAASGAIRAGSGAVAEPRAAYGGSALAYPAHALATATRLFVSDTGHHRLLECALDGRVLRQFGSGTPGDFDGGPDTCGFSSPRGLADGGDCVYVADAGNDAVRRIRLDTGDVETVLGASAPTAGARAAPMEGLHAAVHAPHAVAAQGDVLYVAASGQHQILRADLRAQGVAVIAGDGRYDVRDGIGGEASFAQPGALATAPGQLLVADSGGNAIRRVRFADLAVTTLAGASTWEAGCADGTGRDARLAFPGGLAAAENRVYVADTCNDRLGVLDPYSGDLTTLRLDRPLHAPVGLSFAHGALWVADRDSQSILKVDPASGACERVPVGE